MMKYKISDIINSNIAISQKKAVIAYNFVEDKIKSNTAIDVSFDNIEDCSSLFLNHFIGKLYLDFGFKKVNDLLSISNVSSDIIKHKIENSIKFGTDQNLLNLHSNSLNEILA